MNKITNPINIHKATAPSNQKRLKEAIEPYQKVAKGMEAQFINYLLQKMRSTILKNEPDGSEMNYYKSILDQEHANIMATKDGGLGIQPVILNQLLPHSLKNAYNKGRLNNNAAIKIKEYQKIHKNSGLPPARKGIPIK